MSYGRSRSVPTIISGASLDQAMTTIYCARWVLPISAPVIEDGSVAIEGARIVAVGRRNAVTAGFPQARITECGEAAILPGLINAHSHLELTVMRGFLEREEHDFFAWLLKLTFARMALTPEDIQVSATWGALEAARAGVTCLADASDSANESMKALREVGLRGIVYQESFGPDPKLAKENLAKLQEKVGKLRDNESSLVKAGVSPHSPYTVSAPQLELISEFALKEKLPLMIHAAESQAEDLLLRAGQGPFAEALRRRGIEWQTPGTSSIQHLARHGVLETKPLLAHCITVDNADIESIRAKQAGIAHCPKSNAKLGHGHAPFTEFLQQHVNVGLGSDSVASNNTCDLLEEARFATLLARSFGETEGARHLPAAEGALFSATLGGARALGIDKETGAIAEGLQADLAIVRLDGLHQQPVRDPVDALVSCSSASDVRITIVAGNEIYRDGRITTMEEAPVKARVEEIRKRMG
ncbi:MAG: amidohydrolase family protein [Pyrinomonadaceae bacterium]